MYDIHCHLAYGVSDGQKTAPYVFDNAAGYIAALGNNDGPVRLVYDPSYLTSAGTSADLPAVFKSCAYLYVEQGAGAPGFKHSEASDAAYDNPANTDYFITFTGSALGREVNLTVAELEAMVKYGSDGKPAADGIGLRQITGVLVELVGVKAVGVRADEHRQHVGTGAGGDDKGREKEEIPSHCSE